MRSSPALWVVLAGALGFTGVFVFSGLLRWPRNLLILPHVLIVAGFSLVYVRANRIDPVTQLRRHWPAGVVGGLLVGAVLVRGVLSQPPSGHPAGTALVGTLAWVGLVYGLADALLLNVLPVLATFASPLGDRARRGTAARLAVGGAALGASLLVTAAYHLGYAEFRGASLLQPLIGNTIVTAGYLLTGSPIAALSAHVIMHGAAVLRGMETAVQLPPHY